MLRLGRHGPDASADHLRRPGEEAVGVRVVRGSDDIVRADIVSQHGNASLNRLGRCGSSYGSLQLQLAQLLNIGAAGAEDVADIGAAG
jgi:hypothetical protein